MRFSPNQQAITSQDSAFKVLRLQEGISQFSNMNIKRVPLQHDTFIADVSSQLLEANLVLLILYIVLGAIFYANYANDSPLNALLASFAFITTSEYPRSSFNCTSKSLGKAMSKRRGSSTFLQPDNWSVWLECLYLVGGLNLLSSVLHLVWLVCSNWRKFHMTDETIEGLNEAPRCNGTAPSIVGGLDQAAAPMELSNVPSGLMSSSSFEPEAIEVISSPITPLGMNIDSGQSNPCSLHQAAATISSSSTASVQNHSQQTLQPAYNLTELFVVSQQPAGHLHHLHHHHHHRHSQMSHLHHDADQNEATIIDSGSSSINKNNSDQFSIIQTAGNHHSDLSLTMSTTDPSICLHQSKDYNSARIYQQAAASSNQKSGCQLLGPISAHEHDKSLSIDEHGGELNLRFGTVLAENGSNYSLTSGTLTNRKHSTELYHPQNGSLNGHQVVTLGRNRGMGSNVNRVSISNGLGSFANLNIPDRKR